MEEQVKIEHTAKALAIAQCILNHQAALGILQATPAKDFVNVTNESTPIENLVSGIITALQEQTKAITSLVESNQRLMMILTEGSIDEDDTPSATYLDGTPK